MRKVYEQGNRETNIEGFKEYVEQFRQPAYYYGIRPLEFLEMTCKEIGEYVESQKQRDRDNLTLTSSIGYRIGEMLILSNSLSVKKPKILKFEELFPELELENNNSKEQEIENKWREFLGVVK